MCSPCMVKEWSIIGLVQGKIYRNHQKPMEFRPKAEMSTDAFRLAPVSRGPRATCIGGRSWHLDLGRDPGAMKIRGQIPFFNDPKWTLKWEGDLEIEDSPLPCSITRCYGISRSIAAWMYGWWTNMMEIYLYISWRLNEHDGVKMGYWQWISSDEAWWILPFTQKVDG